MKSDTIAAIATALTDSGIGIIRVSGPDSISIVDNLFRTKTRGSILKNAKSHTIHYGFIFDGNEIIDEVMTSIMKAPRSYTTEDTVEIDCHGGILLMNKILETVVKNGARIAEPGEFTKRAFLNGRIDLSKAEAVMDIINAQNEFALRSSMAQLDGSVSNIIRNLRNKILYEIAFIESALDDPEHISIEGYQNKLLDIVEDLLKELFILQESSKNGKIIKEGINTVIVGKPNVGKSSLLNRLVGEEKAIVTDIAGTTRDIIKENIKLKGISLNIIDTAGIRKTEDQVEMIGVDRAKKYAMEADLVVHVIDASLPLDQNDMEIFKMIQNKKTVILLNKTDLEAVVTKDTILEIMNKEKYDDKNIEIMKTSTKEDVGIDIFEETVINMFMLGKVQYNNEVIITNMRHREAINNAINSLNMVNQSLKDHMPEDFYSIDLMSAYSELGYIIGEEISDDLMTEIFSKFCMGK